MTDKTNEHATDEVSGEDDWPEQHDPVQATHDQLDARGLRCPEPLLLVRNRLREMAPGSLLYVQATDPSTHRDFEQLCRFVGHRLEGHRQRGEVFEFLLRRKP